MSSWGNTKSSFGPAQFCKVRRVFSKKLVIFTADFDFVMQFFKI